MEKNVIKKNTHGVTGKVTSSSKKKRQISSGVVHINSSFNNTIVTVSDAQGDVITWSSAGGNNFKGSKKSTPYAAQVTAEKAVRSAKEFGLKTASIKIMGDSILKVYEVNNDFDERLDILLSFTNFSGFYLIE
jgi:ribosomal protein S11